MSLPPSVRNDFLALIGCRDLGWEDETYRIELTLDAPHMSPANRAHGGVLFSMLDTVLGRAVIEHLKDGRGVATVEMKINYFRPVQQGTITASGRLREKTRRLAYAEGEIHNEEGKVLARASGTFFITEALLQPDRERV